jgi:hypothetical protein
MELMISVTVLTVENSTECPLICYEQYTVTLYRSYMSYVQHSIASTTNTAFHENLFPR